MALEFHVSTGSSVPIYRQIADQIRRAVASGKLEAGAQLPSVRALAEQLTINPNTVARAYGDLTREGVVAPQPGRGLFIAARRPVFSRHERLRRLDMALEALIEEVMLLEYSSDEITQQLRKKLAKLGLDGTDPSSSQPGDNGQNPG